VSKYQFTESDIYLPGTDIPRNRLGIEAPDLLHEVEERLLQQAYRQFIIELDTSVRFDEDCFKSLQQKTFESLYEWSGLYRTVDMSKGGSLFCRVGYIEQESRRIFRDLEQEQFLKQAAEWAPEKFAERLAHYQSELIALHPF
jgi:cell filamentation protein